MVREFDTLADGGPAQVIKRYLTFLRDKRRRETGGCARERLHRGTLQLWSVSKWRSVIIPVVKVQFSVLG